MQQHTDHITLLEKEDMRRVESDMLSSVSPIHLYPYLPQGLFCPYHFSTGAGREINNETMVIQSHRVAVWWLVSAHLISPTIKPLTALLQSADLRFTDVSAELLFQCLIWY